jgi:hypothetical protein
MLKSKIFRNHPISLVLIASLLTGGNGFAQTNPQPPSQSYSQGDSELIQRIRLAKNCSELADIREDIALVALALGKLKEEQVAARQALRAENDRRDDTLLWVTLGGMALGMLVFAAVGLEGAAAATKKYVNGSNLSVVFAGAGLAASLSACSNEDKRMIEAKIIQLQKKIAIFEIKIDEALLIMNSRIKGLDCRV